MTDGAVDGAADGLADGARDAVAEGAAETPPPRADLVFFCNGRTTLATDFLTLATTFFAVFETADLRESTEDVLLDGAGDDPDREGGGGEESGGFPGLDIL